MVVVLAALIQWIRKIPLRYRQESAQPGAQKTVSPPPWRRGEREKPDLDV
jgi:hypothetical protein